MTIIAFPPVAGLIEVVEDIEREDGDRPEGPDAAFWRLVLPLAQQMPDDSDDVCPVCGKWACTCGQRAAVAGTPGFMAACGSCGGSGGYPETTYDADGTQRTTWHSCGACGGSGQG